jgi:hypothetical protein
MGYEAGHEPYPTRGEHDTNERLREYLDAAVSSHDAAVPDVSPEELHQIMQYHRTVMFEAGVPGYESSLVIPVPPEVRRGLVEERARLEAENPTPDIMDTDWPMDSLPEAEEG